MCLCVYPHSKPLYQIVINPGMKEGLYVHRLDGRYITILTFTLYKLCNEYVLLVNEDNEHVSLSNIHMTALYQILTKFQRKCIKAYRPLFLSWCA